MLDERADRVAKESMNSSSTEASGALVVDLASPPLDRRISRSASGGRGRALTMPHRK